MTISRALDEVLFVNPHYGPTQEQEVTNANDVDKVDEARFHADVLPDYHPTPLHAISVAGFAGKVFIKDESNRFGLPSFKVLGGSLAAFVELCTFWHIDANKATLDDVRQRICQSKPEQRPTLVTATDGNHGRGLAWFAKQVGVTCQVFVPASVVEQSIENIKNEGAMVQQLKCDYDEAVRHANDVAQRTANALLIQDTAWQGYERVPQCIVQGYGTLMREIYAQCKQNDGQADANQDQASSPTHVICPVGVGSLATAVVRHSLPYGTRVIAVEPRAAACLFASLRRNAITSIKTGSTIMPGLNCGTVSSDAWPTLQSGVHACVQVTDEEAGDAMHALRTQYNIDVGPCGAAPLAALRLLCQDTQACQKLGLN